MFHDPRHNPHGRFDGLGGVYAKYRPDYPADAIDWLADGLPAGNAIADIGAGTGILSRQLGDRGFHVIGIEPNASMCDEALLQPRERVSFRQGTAETTGLAANSVDAVVAAQAFHWFDREAALREFHRILRAGGRLALLWNIADESDPFTAAYLSILRSAAIEPEVVREPHDRTGAILLDHPMYADSVRRTFANRQVLDEAGLLGRAFSASFAPKECGASERLAGRLRQLFRSHSRDGRICLEYRTTVYRAQRRD